MLRPLTSRGVLGGVYNNPLDRNPLDQIGLAFAYNKIDEKAVGSKLDHDAEKVNRSLLGLGNFKMDDPDAGYPVLH